MSVTRRKNVAIARADGAITEEIEILEAKIRDEAKHHNIVSAETVFQDVPTMLAELEPTEAMLDLAARAIVRDDGARDRLGNWIKLTTYADETGSDEERAAIARVTDAFVRARTC